VFNPQLIFHNSNTENRWHYKADSEYY